MRLGLHINAKGETVVAIARCFNNTTVVVNLGQRATIFNSPILFWVLVLLIPPWCHPRNEKNKKKKWDNAAPPNQRHWHRTDPNELVARLLAPGRCQRGGGGEDAKRADANVPGVATATAVSHGRRGDAVTDAAASATAAAPPKEGRLRSDFMPSHPQLSALVAKCLPLEKASLFAGGLVKTFSKSREKTWDCNCRW